MPLACYKEYNTVLCSLRQTLLTWVFLIVAFVAAANVLPVNFMSFYFTLFEQKDPSVLCQSQ